ncbi:hypothetical protein HK104_008055 [Borealophlyctis nickersoniae]|nr:hypothetical protein HK104_008055 [Borealophlyctis nickersoniae]
MIGSLIREIVGLQTTPYDNIKVVDDVYDALAGAVGDATEEVERVLWEESKRRE